MASRHLTSRLRQLARVTALTEADAGTLGSVTRRVDDLIAELDGGLREGVLSGDFDQGRVAYAGKRRIGDHNVRVVPMELEFEDGRAVARVVPDELMEGAPGLLHGGEASWFVDCMCGLLIEEEVGAPRTATLTLDYRAPTPIDATLVLRSAIEEKDGRKIWVVASIEADGVVTVEARGLFILPRV